MKKKKLVTIGLIFLLLSACNLAKDQNTNSQSQEIQTNIKEEDCEEENQTEEIEICLSGENEVEGAEIPLYESFAVVAWYGDIVRGPETLSSVVAQITLWPDGSD